MKLSFTKLGRIALLSFVMAFSLIQSEATAQSCMLAPVSLEQRVNASHVILEAKIIDKMSYKSPVTNGICTAYQLEVYKVFKGVYSSQTATVITEGGNLETESLEVFPSFSPQVGEMGIFCLNHHKDATPFGVANIFKPYALSQGFIKYDENMGGAFDVFDKYQTVEGDLFGRIQGLTQKSFNIVQERLNTSLTPPVFDDVKTINILKNKDANGVFVGNITGFSPTTIARGETLTINGTGFLAQGASSLVFFKSNVAGETFRGSTSNIVSWSNTQVRVRVPFDVQTDIVLMRLSDGSQIQSTARITITPAAIVTPTITNFTASAVAGGNVTITGNNFLTPERPAQVFFTKAGDAANNPTLAVPLDNANVSSWSNTSITVKVPATAIAGKIKVQNRTLGSVLTATNFALSTPGVSGSMSLTSFTPTSGNAGVGQEITINGSGFTATRGTVGFSNGDDGGSTKIFVGLPYITSWTNTQIKVKVPTKAGTGTIVVKLADGSNQVVSAGTLTINFSHLTLERVSNGAITTVNATNLANKNGAGGYTFKLTSSFAANAPAKAAFIRALETWRCTTGVNFKLDPIALATNTCNVTASDQVNTVGFDSGCQLSAGVLGVCFSYMSTCGTDNTKTSVPELDVIFDTPGERSWGFGPAAPTQGQSDFESVAVHELGHGHRLGHIINPGAVMHFALTSGTTSRTLGAASDVAGGNLAMTNSSPFNCNSVTGMTRLLAAECRVTQQGASDEPPMANFMVDKMSGCSPLMVSLTNLSENDPEMFEWDINGDGLTDYTTKDIQHTFTTPGTYTVSLKVSNIYGDNVKTMRSLIKVVPEVKLSVNTENISVCKGEMVNLEAMGAMNYSWNPSMGMMNSGSKFSFMPMTSTVITVTGSNGACTQMRKINVTVNSAPMIKVNTMSPKNGNDGQINIEAMGGTMPYTYWVGEQMQMNPTFMGLTSGTYNVTVMDAKGCKMMSQVTLSGERVCMMPTGLMAKEVGTVSAVAMWTSQSMTSKYEFVYRMKGTSNWMTRTTPNNYLTIEGLKPSTGYELKVRSWCGNMMSDYSMMTEIMTQEDMMNCMAPMVNVTEVNAMTAKIMWKGTPQANSYMVYYRMVGATDWKSKMASKMDNWTNLTELMPSTNYEVKVNSICGWNMMAASKTEMFKTTGQAMSCAPVMNLMATPMITQANLMWNASEGATSYVIYWKQEGATKWMSKTIASVSNMFAIQNLEPGKRYEARVKANCNMMSSEPMMVSFMTMTPRQMSESSQEINNTQIVPNPNNGVFAVKFNSLGQNETNISVRDIAGREILHRSIQSQSGLNEVTMDIHGISAGMYTVQVSSKSMTQTVKLVVE